MKSKYIEKAKVNCWRSKYPGNKAFFSPSIEYCGHSRYAEPWEANGKYWQIVFQVRLNPNFTKNMIIEKGTIGASGAGNKERVDPNFENTKLEWIVERPPSNKVEWMKIYGIMIRTSDFPLEQLPQNQWWSGKLLSVRPSNAMQNKEWYEQFSNFTTKGKEKDTI